MIRRVKIPTITTTGANGSAAGTGDSPVIDGRVLAVHIDFTSEPNTTDITLATLEAPAQTILTVTSSNTDGWRYPRTAVQDATGAAVTYDGTRPIYEPLAVVGVVRATVAQGDGSGTIDITIIYEE